MADGGTSELIMLVTALLTGGIVAGLLLTSWGGLATAVDAQQQQAAADAVTRADLASDAMAVSWDQTNCNMTLHLQNSGAANLETDGVAFIINGTAATVNGRAMLGASAAWIPGEVVEFWVCPTGLTLNSGDEIRINAIVQSTPMGGATGSHAFGEVIRIA